MHVAGMMEIIPHLLNRSISYGAFAKTISWTQLTQQAL